MDPVGFITPARSLIIRRSKIRIQVEPGRRSSTTQIEPHVFISQCHSTIAIQANWLFIQLDRRSNSVSRAQFFLWFGLAAAVFTSQVTRRFPSSIRIK